MMKVNLFRSRFLFTFLTVLPFALSACSRDSGSFFLASLDLQNPKIIVASQQAGSTAVVMYDADGRFIRTLHDYSAEAGTPRGLIALGPLEFLITVEGNDHIDRFSLVDGRSGFVSTANLNGNIYQGAKHDEHGVFVIETNVIEAFDFQGVRSGNPRVPATVGGCTLNVPRGMTFNRDGHLVVVGTGNDAINVYDVTNAADPVCVRSNASLGNVDPVAVLAHSDGFLYVATVGNDRIYRFAGDGSGVGTVVYNNINYVNNPSALAEMPDGTILVASDGTNAIVRMTTDGVVLGLTNFIQDTFTNNVSEIIILQESTQ